MQKMLSSIETKSQKYEDTRDIIELRKVILFNAEDFKARQEPNIKDKISDKLLSQITDTLVYKRPEYIQLLDKTLDCFQYKNSKLTSTMDEELEIRFIFNDFEKLLLKLNRGNYDIDNWIQEFSTWKEAYLQDPLGEISFFNSEIQEQIQICLKFGTQEDKTEVTSLLGSLNKLYKFIFDSGFINEGCEEERDENTPDLLVGVSKASDILTKTETIIKRIRSILKKLINLHSGNEQITFEDFTQKVNDVSRSTVYLDDIPDLDTQKIFDFVIKTDNNLQELYTKDAVIKLNNKNYKITSSKIIKDIRYKPTGYPDISFVVELETHDESHVNSSFKLEIQAHTRKAIEVKKVEDEIYAERKKVRISLSSLANFKIFEEIILSQNQNITLGFIDRIGLRRNFEESHLTFQEFITSKDYRNLYIDCLLINFPTLVQYFNQNLSNKTHNKPIFRLFQDIAPLSFQMRRFIAEAKAIYSNVGLFKSSSEAKHLYNSLIRSGVENVNSDITNIDLESEVLVEDNLLYFGNNGSKILIGSISKWSKLLRCDYEKTVERIQLLLTPNWHTNKLGVIEKAPELNTRFIVYNQGRIALVYNPIFKEMELPGCNNNAIMDENRNYVDLALNEKINMELDLGVVGLRHNAAPVEAGNVILGKKLKDVSILFVEATRITKLPNTDERNELKDINHQTIWIDPIELLIWKYWLNKPLNLRPKRYEIPLAPYATFTHEIFSQLEYGPNKKYTPEIIESIGKIILQKGGIVTPDYVRLQMLQNHKDLIF